MALHRTFSLCARAHRHCHRHQMSTPARYCCEHGASAVEFAPKFCTSITTGTTLTAQRSSLCGCAHLKWIWLWVSASSRKVDTLAAALGMAKPPDLAALAIRLNSTRRVTHSGTPVSTQSPPHCFRPTSTSALGLGRPGRHVNGK